ncbi:hypothetical protein [uncultured Treponema sp.]|uniref:hypothetical protein n=1 Tax=uncultured Treponema sp. TaxID=162155 RepID=UPI0025D2A899|nr:hypothetical protein [uncultured Treponema sp.]
MNRTKKIRTVMAAVLAVSCTFSVFGQSSEDVGEAFKRIDMAIAGRSIDAISKVLSDNKSSPNYQLIENYTLKKTRQLIITDNLEFARQTSLAVIDNNIENFDAVELYSYIDKAILNQQAAQQAAENRKRLEEERIAARNAKSKAQLESRGNYHVVSTASGQEVYVNEQKASFSSWIWTVKLGLADFVYQKVSEPDYSSLKYGLALGANVFRPSERFIIGADLFADAHIVTFSTSGGLEGEAKLNSSGLPEAQAAPQEFFMSGRFVPEFAFADLSKYLFVRAGLAAHILASNDRDRTGSTDTFISPVIGAAFENVPVGEAVIRAFYDYDLGHLAYEDINSAMEFGGSILLPMAVNDKTKVGVEFGFQDLLVMRNVGGMENRTKITFAIGVGNVTK